MLEQDAADRLLGLCEEQIDSYTNPETPVGDEDLELLAESLCGLGFFVEALSQQRSDLQRLIAPLLAKRLGEVVDVQDDGGDGDGRGRRQDLRGVLPMLVAEIRRAPADPAARAELTAKLKELVDDATLIDDSELIEQAQEALTELEALAAVETAARTADTADTEDTRATRVRWRWRLRSAQSPKAALRSRRRLPRCRQRRNDCLLQMPTASTPSSSRSSSSRRPRFSILFAKIARSSHETLAIATRCARRAGSSTRSRAVAGWWASTSWSSLPTTSRRSITSSSKRIATSRPRCSTSSISPRRTSGSGSGRSRTGDVYADPAALYAAIGRVAAELPSEFEPDAATAPQPVAQETAADEPLTAPPDTVPARSGEELSSLEPIADEPTALEASPPDEESSLTKTIAFEPVPVELQLPPVEFSAPKVVAEEALAESAPEAEVVAAAPSPPVAWVDSELEEVDADAEIIEFAPVGEMPVGADAGHGAPPPPDIITVGDVAVPAELFAVLVDEAQVHLATLAHELSLLQFDSRQLPSAEMVRASHTLCGIHRAGGFPLIALTAGSLEQCLLALQPLAAPLPTEALPALADAVGGLGEFLGRVRERRSFNATDVAIAAEIQQELEAVRRKAAMAPPAPDTGLPVIDVVDAEPEAAPQRDVSPTIAPARAASVAAETARREIPLDPLADIRDDVDTQVLPIFLEEAAELYPQAGERVRAWRRAPGDDGSGPPAAAHPPYVQRSARMAGAMRLGELVHLMESRLDVDDAPVPGLGRVVRSAGWRSRPYRFRARRPARGQDQCRFVVGRGQGRGGGDLRSARASRRKRLRPLPRNGRWSVSLPTPDHAASRVEADAVDVETGARAMLRVRADIIDRLVNEAGEVAIARARIESELRALKANLLELTGSVIRLRTQVREIEIQAESQIQSRLMQVGEGAGGIRPARIRPVHALSGARRGRLPKASTTYRRSSNRC